MRKQLLLAAGALAFSTLNAQTVLVSEDFDTYAAGDMVAEVSDLFQTWSGGAGEDTPISDVEANSGSNSLLVEANGADVIMGLGPHTSGKIDVIFQVYIPNGNGGYFNLLHEWDEDANYEWAVDVYFSSTGDLTWTAGGTDGGGASFTSDTWFEMQVTADMDNDMGYLYAGGELLHSWQWSLNNADGTVGQNQLMALNFFGYQPTGSGPGLMYVDDIRVLDSTGLSIGEQEDISNIGVSPNPASDFVTFNSPLQGTDVEVSIMNIAGQQVDAFTLEAGATHRHNVTALQSGVYLVRVTSGVENTVQRLVIQ